MPNIFDKYNIQSLAEDLTEAAKTNNKQRQKWDDLAADVLDGYSGKLGASEVDSLITKSQKAMPLLFDAVEGLYSQVFRAMFPVDEEFFRISTDKKSQRGADILSKYLHKKIRESGMAEIDKQTKLACALGVAVCRMSYTNDVRKIEYFDHRTSGNREVSKTKKRGVAVEVLSHKDWGVELDRGFSEGITWHRWIDRDQRIKSLADQGIYENYEELKVIETSQDSDSSLVDNDRSGYEQHRRESGNMSSEDESTKKKLKTYELVQYFGDIPMKRKTDEEYELVENVTVVVAEGKVVLMAEDMGTMDGENPFVVLRYGDSIDPKNPLGNTPIINALPIYWSCNQIFNLLLDSGEMQVKSPLAYNPLDTHFLKWVASQGGRPKIEQKTLIPTRYGIGVVDTGAQNMQIAYTLLGEMINKFQEATKSIKNFTQRGYDKTATEISGVLEGIGTYMSQVVTAMQRDFVPRFVSKYYNLWRQYEVFVDPQYAAQDMIDTLDDETLFDEIPFEEIVKDWEFMPAGNNHFAVRLKRVQQVQTFFNMILPIPGGVERIKVEEMIHYLAREFEASGYEKFVMNDEEWAAYMQQKQQQAAQAKQEAIQNLMLQTKMKMAERDPASAMIANELMGAMMNGNDQGQSGMGTSDKAAPPGSPEQSRSM